MEPNDIQQLDETAQRRAELSELLPSSFGEMMVVFNKWMLIPDPGIIKFLCAFYCANRLWKSHLGIYYRSLWWR